MVSGADSVYVKGALEATKLGEFFEDTFSPDSLNAFKGSLQYWKRILRRSKSHPEYSVVVDDRPKFLVTPAGLGLSTILVSPRISWRFKAIPSIEQLVSVIASG